LDPQKRIYGLYATKYVPRSFVIDRQGIIRHIYVEYELDALDAILTAAEQLAK
jgi:peroxiredoxin